MCRDTMCKVPQKSIKIENPTEMKAIETLKRDEIKAKPALQRRPKSKSKQFNNHKTVERKNPSIQVCLIFGLAS